MPAQRGLAIVSSVQVCPGTAGSDERPFYRTTLDQLSPVVPGPVSRRGSQGGPRTDARSNSRHPHPIKPPQINDGLSCQLITRSDGLRTTADGFVVGLFPGHRPVMRSPADDTRAPRG